VYIYWICQLIQIHEHLKKWSFFHIHEFFIFYKIRKIFWTFLVFDVVEKINRRKKHNSNLRFRTSAWSKLLGRPTRRSRTWAIAPLTVAARHYTNSPRKLGPCNSGALCGGRTPYAWAWVAVSVVGPLHRGSRLGVDVVGLLHGLERLGTDAGLSRGHRLLLPSSSHSSCAAGGGSWRLNPNELF
jgi:hypothetical protein